MCDYPRCRSRDDSDGVVYKGKQLCWRCWARACDRNENLDQVLNIKQEQVKTPVNLFDKTEVQQCLQ